MGVSARSEKPGSGHAGTLVQEAEDLLRTLTGVHGVRVVSGQGGEIVEIHVLTGENVSPKQTVRNVESALLAHLNLPIDHRKISVAQSGLPSAERAGQEGTLSLVLERPSQAVEQRIVYRSHVAEPDGESRVRFRVSLTWAGDDYDGSAVAPDLPRSRREAVAKATLKAVEAICQAAGGDVAMGPEVVLNLGALDIVKAFDNEFAFVVIEALAGREVRTLSGAAPVGGRSEASFILATLQAVDRWVRGQLT